MDEEKLRAAAECCCAQVLRYGSRQGFTHSDFVTRVPAYRELELKAQFRTLVLLAKRREISSLIGRRGAWHFYARSLAPEGAFNVADSQQESAVVRAIEKTA